MKTLKERELMLRGFKVEVFIKGKTAYRCEVNYPKMLFSEGLSSIDDENY